MSLTYFPCLSILSNVLICNTIVTIESSSLSLEGHSLFASLFRTASDGLCWCQHRRWFEITRRENHYCREIPRKTDSDRWVTQNIRLSIVPSVSWICLLAPSCVYRASESDLLFLLVSISVEDSALIDVSAPCWNDSISFFEPYMNDICSIFTIQCCYQSQQSCSILLLSIPAYFPFLYLS